MALLGLFDRRSQRAIIARQLRNQRRFGDSEPFDFEWDVRADQYAFNKSMLDNSVYESQSRGGYLEQIVSEVFRMEWNDEIRMGGVYNPVREIVDCYQNVFRGSFGQEIRVDRQVNERDVNTKLTDAESPIRKIWNWSNLNTSKSLMQEWAANLGTVGLRIVARDDQKRVSIQLDHPGAITDFNEDDRGNVVEIELRSVALVGPLGEDRHEVKVREIISKDRYFREVDGKTDIDRPNALGVCQYVILRHRDDGHEFGRWAYAGSENIIHWLNWIISNQGESVVEHSWPTWFGAAGGNAPTRFKIGRSHVAYVKIDPDTAAPIFTPLVANIDQKGSMDYWIELIQKLTGRQPELIVGMVKILSGISGETLAKVLIPAESVVLRARAQYEHAMIRALQIGTSECIRIGVADVGTGTGSAEAANSAYEKGLEDFSFAERPALPQSTYDVIQNSIAEVAPQVQRFSLAKAAEGMVDKLTQLKLAGYSEADAKKIIEAMQTTDAIPTEQL